MFKCFFFQPESRKFGNEKIFQYKVFYIIKKKGNIDLLLFLTKQNRKQNGQLFGLNNVYFFHSYISYIHIHIILGSEKKFRELIKSCPSHEVNGQLFM